MCRPFTELHTVQYRSTTKTLWQPLKNEWARSPRRTANIINWVKRVFSHCYFETCLKDHLLLHFVMLSRSLSLSLSYYFFLQLNQNKILNLNFPELEVQGCRKSRFFQIHSLEVFHLLLVVLLQFFLSLSDFFFFPLPSFYFPPLSSSSPIRLPHTNTQPGCKSAPGTGGHLPARRRSRQECDHWFTSQKSWNWKWELGEAQFPPHHLPHPPAGLQQWIGVEGSDHCLFLLSLRVLCIRSSCSKISDARFFDSIRYWFFTDTDTLCGIYFCHDKLQHVMYWYHWIDTRVSIGTSIPQHGYIDTPISTRVLFQSLWMILAMFTFFGCSR